MMEREILSLSGVSNLTSSKNTGWFVAVVGPSGAGKDTIINAVRKIVKDQPDFLFIRRTITRKAGISGEALQAGTKINIGNEDNIAVSEDEFLKLSKNHAFSMEWFGHGIHYGLPKNIADNIKRGKIVIANISREYLEAAKQMFGRIFVVEVNADISILRKRLIMRNREQAEDIKERLGRANVAIHLPVGAGYCYIDNSDNLQHAVEKLLSVLEILAAGKIPDISDKAWSSKNR